MSHRSWTDAIILLSDGPMMPPSITQLPRRPSLLWLNNVASGKPDKMLTWLSGLSTEVISGVKVWRYDPLEKRKTSHGEKKTLAYNRLPLQKHCLHSTDLPHRHNSQHWNSHIKPHILNYGNRNIYTCDFLSQCPDGLGRHFGRMQIKSRIPWQPPNPTQQQSHVVTAIRIMAHSVKVAKKSNSH